MNKSVKTLQLPLESLLYVNRFFSLGFFFYNLSIFTYKALRLPSTQNLMAWNFCSMFLYSIVDFNRLKICSKGNRFSRMNLLLFGLLFTFILVGLHVYYLLQAYVIRLDIVMNVIGLILLGLEISLIGFVTFILKMT